MEESRSNFTLSDEKKGDILMQALGERYNAIHIIRARVQNASLWILGLFITAAGWIIQAGQIILFKERIFFSIMIIVAVFILRGL